MRDRRVMMKAGYVSGVVLCALGLTACSQTATTSADMAPADHAMTSSAGTAGDEADTATRTHAANQTYRKPDMPTMPAEPELSLVMINNGAGVLNPEFNEFTDLVPTYWTMRSGPVRIHESADTGPAVKMGPGYTYNFLSQDLVFAESPAGKTITLTAQARTAEPDKAMIAIICSDSQKFYSEKHPGDDQWHELTVTAQVPQDFQGNSVGIMLSHSGSPQQPVWFDHVNVQAQ